ncbi:MAG TPA: hypothetical protein VLF62_05620 [Candidatus Saccharimonadales bacterium]|nr:hypothetical protein [Candidatus Saccharimonadales bacterium]
MAEVVFDASCEQVAAQLEPYLHATNEGERVGWRKPTIICSLYAPETGEVALVRPWRALGQESADQALAPPQTTYRPPEEVGQALVRKTTEGLSLSLDALVRVHGLHTEEQPFLAGRKLGRRRVFGVLCGVVAGRPELAEDQDKYASGQWYTFGQAEAAFQIQAASHLHERGQRNLRVLDHIRALGRQLGSTAE